MNTTQIKQDSFYAPILFAIESRIAAADREAHEEGISLTDSQVRSVLNRLRKQAKAPDLNAGTHRDQILARLQNDLAYLANNLVVQDSNKEEASLPAHEWNLCLRTVEDSIRLRSSGAGSRSYLEFIADFVGRAGRA